MYINMDTCVCSVCISYMTDLYMHVLQCKIAENQCDSTAVQWSSRANRRFVTGSVSCAARWDVLLLPDVALRLRS